MNHTELMVMGQGAIKEKVTINPVPHGAADLDKLRKEIDKLDAEILRLVQYRTEVSRSIGAARMAAGGPRIVYKREMDVLARFRELGPDGSDLAMLLLRLGRGRLGARRNDQLGTIDAVPAVHHPVSIPLASGVIHSTRRNS